MEVYVEQSINNPSIDKHLKRTNVLLILRYVLLVIGVLIGLILVAFSPAGKDVKVFVTFINIAFGILSAAPFVLAFFFINRFIAKTNLEFDYVLTGSTFRIIKVINRLKRKKMLEFSVSNIESIGRVSGETYDRYAASKDIKKVFAVCNFDDENDVFYIYYILDGVKQLLHIEPDSDMIIALRRSVPRISIIDKSVGMVKQKEKEDENK